MNYIIINMDKAYDKRSYCRKFFKENPYKLLYFSWDNVYKALCKYATYKIRYYWTEDMESAVKCIQHFGPSHIALQVIDNGDLCVAYSSEQLSFTDFGSLREYLERKKQEEIKRQKKLEKERQEEIKRQKLLEEERKFVYFNIPIDGNTISWDDIDRYLYYYWDIDKHYDSIGSAIADAESWDRITIRVSRSTPNINEHSNIEIIYMPEGVKFVSRQTWERYYNKKNTIHKSNNTMNNSYFYIISNGRVLCRSREKIHKHYIITWYISDKSFKTINKAKAFVKTCTNNMSIINQFSPFEVLDHNINVVKL